MKEPLRIWSDPSFVPDGLASIGMLAPWFHPNHSARAGRLAGYLSVAPSLFRMVDLAEAEVAVLPFNWEYTTWEDASFYPASRDRALAFHARAREAGVPVAIFYETDVMREIPLEGALVFGPSLRRSRRRPHEFAIPGWTEDLLTKYRGGELAIRRKTERPSVGFCGFAPPLAVPWGTTKAKESIRWVLNRTGLIEHSPADPGPFARVEAIRHLRRSDAVDTELIVRPFVVRPNRPTPGAPTSGLDTLHGAPGGVGGRATMDTAADAPSQAQTEFLDNMLSNDYVLCARGFGNYSYRLYEALSCGRIPVFVDTDCVLPYDFDIDWRRRCVWVDQGDVRSIGDIVASFHASLSPGDFEELQITGRRLWEERLSPEGFFSYFGRHLDTQEPLGGSHPQQDRR